jgi:hypothetical protein
VYDPRNEVAMLSAPLYKSTDLINRFEVLAHFSKVMRMCAVMLEVNAFFLVIFV